MIIADDHKMNRDSIVKQFNNWNIDVVIHEAVDGVDLITKVKNEEYDVILSDIRMPNMGGIEAAIKIREFDKHVIIIGLSADATVKGIEDSRKAGMNDYLTKPIQFNLLLQKIAKEVNLPLKVFKKTINYSDDKKLLARVRNITLDDKDFSKTANELVDDICVAIKKLHENSIRYDDVHSLLNKTIYIGDQELIDKVKLIQDLVVKKEIEKAKNELKELSIIWGSVLNIINDVING